MSNIWEFLLQTLTVSLTAAFLLLLKKLFEDKLPPRWQYSIWGLLALRILLPTVTRNRYVMLPLPVWIETLKASAEQNLSSAFSAPYDPVSPTSGLPWPSFSQSGSQGAAFSITDILFLIYITGILVCLLRYTVSYIQLRQLLHRSSCPVPEALQIHIAAAAEKYGLKTCPAVLVEGLPSAFVCGVFKPRLALPCSKGSDGAPQTDFPDEKVLLHELLHLKHKDALQSVFWSLLRAFHWCNPFLQHVFDRIGNDMEALCDQRVLEMLEGEERREYGNILLGMTNDRYPRAFGTTSLSNGAANIARRIGCIARFKKYPKGMGLVSACIALMLVSPLFAGSAAYTIKDHITFPEDLQSTMALTRLNRCTTVAGAIDTYYKGLYLENLIYTASAVPLDRQAELVETVLASNLQGGTYRTNYVLASDLNGWPYTDRVSYQVHNLRRSETSGASESDTSESYDAELVIPLERIGQYAGDLEVWVKEQGPEVQEKLKQFEEEYGSNSYPGCAVYYLTVSQDAGSWAVTERMPREIFFTGDISENQLSRYEYAEYLPASGYGIYTAETPLGTIEIRTFSTLTVDNAAASTSSFFPTVTAFDDTLKLNADFNMYYMDTSSTFVFAGSEEDRAAVTMVSMELVPVGSLSDPQSQTSLEDETLFSDPAITSDNISGGSSDGSSFTGYRGAAGEWDGTLYDGGGTGFTPDRNFLKNLTSSLPAAYAVRIEINDQEAGRFYAMPAWTAETEVK